MDPWEMNHCNVVWKYGQGNAVSIEEFLSMHLTISWNMTKFCEEISIYGSCFSFKKQVTHWEAVSF